MILAIIAGMMVLTTITFTCYVRISDIPVPLMESPTRHSEEHKLRIYEGLRDLQFEYRLGKLSDHDYRRTKATLQQELAALTKEIDHLPAKAQLQPSTRPTIICKSCRTCFSIPMKFCGQCGKWML